MAEEKACVKIFETDQEELFFKEQDRQLIQALREKMAKQSNEQEREEHKNHCFRCGTLSLTQVRHGNILIDVCVNEGCGAVHLDPGELESIGKDTGSLKKISKTVLGIFK